jgi:cysteine synthase B
MSRSSTVAGAAWDALAARVGNTPLVALDFVPGVAREGVLFAKLETANPNGSLKDRPVLRMLTGALESGALRGRRLLDSTSGNAGIAYAAFGASLGVGVTLVIPGNASRERLDRIRAHGAEVVLTDPVEGYDFAIAEAARLAREHPDRYWYCNQYANEDNWRAHLQTGREIIEQMIAATGGVPDALVCGIGTGGSITGIGRRLRAANPRLHVVAVIPETFPGIEGLKPLSPGDLVPPILDEWIISERVLVSSEEALASCRMLARNGYFVGPSSGAYVHVAAQLVARGTFARIVTLLCDTGERYFSTHMWSEPSSVTE